MPAVVSASNVFEVSNAKLTTRQAAEAQCSCIGCAVLCNQALRPMDCQGQYGLCNLDS